ncbi:MAG TPA: tetratricopeptide repeat protein [Flavobacterium sp.]|jgi:tetratricopeptide (TPR) repeat protein
MRVRQIVLATALMASTISFAQKDELKTLKKIYEREIPSTKDVAEYRAALATAEPLMSAASEADKAYFAYYKASAPMVEMATAESAANPQVAQRLLNTAAIQNYAKASQAVLELEKAGKKQYTDDIIQTVTAMKPVIRNYAVQLGNQKKNKEAAEVLNALYLLDKSDADNLYYAANYAIMAQDYDTALKFYDELKSMNYSGEKTYYFATNLASNQEENFLNRADMMKFVALKTHSNPREEKEPSKRGEIYKNIALILVQQGKTDEAIAAVQQARKENPTDTSLVLSEADLYLKLNDVNKYKSIITELVAQTPNDHILFYNLGVVSMNGEQLEEAEKYFKRTIEINPDYTDAYLNLSALKLKADEKLVNAMNSLGTSPADNKKYDQMKAQRNELFQAALPYLEKAHQLDAKNDVVIDNLLSVYNYLGMTDKHQALKAKR